MAGPLRVEIVAEVDADLKHVRGVMTVHGDPATVVDPLAGLPDAPDDRTLLRLAPGRQRTGQVLFEQTGAQEWRFETTLPRRFGDVGGWRRGLYANGAWYPQPVTAEALPIAQWDVRLTLPDDTTAALGNIVGTDSIHWVGRAERAPLAVLRKAQIYTDEWGGQRVSVLGRRAGRRVQKQGPAQLMGEAIGARSLPPVTIVQAPLRRRLVRSGPGLLFASDRTYRLTPGLRGFHDAAVTRGLLESALPIDAPFERSLAAAALNRAVPAPDPSGLLKWFKWNPVVDAVLNDRRLPFWADIFQAPHPEDPLYDDLVERFDPHGPTPALAAQLEVYAGREPLLGIATALIRGESLREATSDTPVSAEHVALWRQRYPAQNLTLKVRDGAATIHRDAPDGAAPEVVTVRGRDLNEHRLMGPGDTWAIDDDPGVSSIVLDPAGLLRQTSRRGDAWPPRFVVLGAAWIDSLNLTERFVSGSATVWARGRDDTRNVWSASGSINQRDLPSFTLGWLHRRGPLQDGLARPHRFSLWATPAWTNPRFADGSVFTVGGGVGYTWDTRVSSLFPLRGRRLNVSVTGGVAPTQDTRWAALRSSFSGVVSPHPRWAFAGRVSGGIADGDTRQRLLWLGGPGVGVSLVPGVAIGDLRGIGQAEVRWAPIRHTSVPLLGLAWLNEVQLTAGAEVMSVRTIEGPWANAVGLTAGAAVVVDLFGAKPGLLGATAGLPAWVEGIDVKPWQRPQVTLRFGQGF
ncbi:MAG: hypothetical protein AB8H79_04715 [Myxococcota bacterium]